MASQADITNVSFLTGEENEQLIGILLDDAQAHVFAYTGRTHMIPQLEKTVRDLAVIALNRMGTEGESGRSEGGESYTFDNMPPYIYEVLNRYRLARVGGAVYEAKAQQAE